VPARNAGSTSSIRAAIVTSIPESSTIDLNCR
jgi:hypothetical protein